MWLTAVKSLGTPGLASLFPEPECHCVFLVCLALIPDIAHFLGTELTKESLSVEAESRRRQLCELLHQLSLGVPVPPDRGKLCGQRSCTLPANPQQYR